MTSSERRVLSRFHIEMPISLQVLGTETLVQATTKDVSASGVFFYTSFELLQGAHIDFVMTLPPELTHADGIQVACKGEILRVQHGQAHGHIGVAAAIHAFDFFAASVSAGSNGS